MATRRSSSSKSSREGREATGAGAVGGTDGPIIRGGLQQLVQPDEALAKIVGVGPLTRAELTSRLWEYVKRHNLQNPNNRRMIRADAALRPILGADEVSMFEMTRRINAHVRPFAGR